MTTDAARAERVLVLAPTERDARLTLDLLSHSGFAVQACAGVPALVDELARGAGALLLTDDVETAPDVGRLAAALAQQPEWSELPVLVLAHPARDSLGLPHLDETPGVTLLERPVRVRTLLSAVRTALRARRRQYQLRTQLDAQRTLQHRLAAELAVMHRLHAMAMALSRPQPIEPQLGHVLETAMELSDADAALLDVDPESAPTHSRVATRGIPLDAGLPRQPLQLLVSGSSQAVWVNDRDDRHAPELRGWLIGAGFHGLLAVPLRSTLGRSLGMLGLLWREASPRDVQLPIELLARLTAGLLERTQHDEERREADRRKDEFLAMLAHELRNPLAPIRQAVRASRAARVTPAQLQWSHDVIDRQVRHMARLLDDLLDLSRITRGRLHLRCERIGVRSAVEAAIETSTPSIQSRRHSLAVAIPDEPVWVDADPVRLAQVLSNLLNNAAKYTDPGGQITLVVEPGADEVVVRVRDTGIGLDAASVGRVFDMFAQVDATHERSQGGLGIGLALVKGVVELHGGQVTAASDGPGRGSEFAVTLRRASAPDAQTPPADGGRRAPAGPSRRIVIADDNVDAAESLALVLRLAGHDVRIVHDGIAAVDAVHRWRPDVAILDIGMPKIDGNAAARRIRALQDGHSPTLVAVTGWGQDEDRRRCRDAGFDAHFTKPVDPDSLLTLVATH